jgi:hypothetical protein
MRNLPPCPRTDAGFFGDKVGRCIHYSFKGAWRSKGRGMYGEGQEKKNEKVSSFQEDSEKDYPFNYPKTNAQLPKGHDSYADAHSIPMCNDTPLLKRHEKLGLWT